MKNRMSKGKTIILFCLTVLLVILMTGCAGAPGMTTRDVDRRHERYIYSNWLLFQEDLDAILYTDRPSRLTPIYTR